MEKPLRDIQAARRATVRVWDRSKKEGHRGQGLLLDLGDEEAVVLTCHHVIAPVKVDDLCVRMREEGGRLGDPLPVRYDQERSQPTMDAVVLRVDRKRVVDKRPLEQRPLLHKLSLDKYNGSLEATILTYLEPDIYTAQVRASTYLDLPAVRSAGGWPDSPERYIVRAFLLSNPEDTRPGISGGVVLCEEGVLGLVHFSRAEGPTHARQGYVVPLTVWAEGLPAQEKIIDPLVDNNLLAAAKVRRADQLEIGTDVDIPNYKPDIYLEREEEQQAHNALAQHQGVVIVGKPMSGKTRMACHLLKERPHSFVVIPRSKHIPPEEFEASGLAAVDDLVVLFDDLHEGADSSDPLGWRDRLVEETGLPCQLVCTVRGGEDWKRVKDQQPRLLDTLGDDACVFTSKVGNQGRDLTEAEGYQLWEQLKLKEKDFEKDFERFDGTPGSLTVDLDDMRERYEHMRKYEWVGGGKDVPMSRLLDSAKLAYEGTGWSLRRSILRAIAEKILGDGRMSDATWETLVDRTADEGFAYFDDSSVLQIYRPYLEECVTYKPSLKQRNLLPRIMLSEDEALREELLLTLELRKIGGPAAQSVILRLIHGELRELVEEFQEYNKPDGIEVTTEDVPEWVGVRLWGTMNGRYIGSARHLPSKYMDILRHYLMSHQSYLERRDKLYSVKKRDSVRIMFGNEEVLKQDREKHKEKYDEFLNWHKENQVELKLLSWKKAQELSKKAGLPRSETTQATDMGYWHEELALLWLYGDDPGRGPVRLRMIFVGDPLYDRCRSFLDAVMKKADPFPGYDSQNSPEDKISAGSEEGH